MDASWKLFIQLYHVVAGLRWGGGGEYVSLLKGSVNMQSLLPLVVNPAKNSLRPGRNSNGDA